MGTPLVGHELMEELCELDMRQQDLLRSGIRAPLSSRIVMGVAKNTRGRGARGPSRPDSSKVADCAPRRLEVSQEDARTDECVEEKNAEITAFREFLSAIDQQNRLSPSGYGAEQWDGRDRAGRFPEDVYNVRGTPPMAQCSLAHRAR